MVKGTFWKIFSKIFSHFEEEGYQINKIWRILVNFEFFSFELWCNTHNIQMGVQMVKLAML